MGSRSHGQEHALLQPLEAVPDRRGRENRPKGPPPQSAHPRPEPQPEVPGRNGRRAAANLQGEVRRIFSLFYAKIMVFGDGQFYRGFGGYW